MIHSRRSLLRALGLTAAVAPLPLAFATRGLAQTYDTRKLAEAGPLEEMAVGAEDAPVTIIEYASMTCGHCRDFHESTYRELKEKYVDTGKVRFVLREFPLDPLSAAAFMLARCAPEGRYFDMVDMLFDTQGDWTQTRDPVTELFNVARQAGFTRESFEACLTNQQLLDGINAVKDRAVSEFDVRSTPTFFINGEMLRGNNSLEVFAERIEPHLGG